MDCQEEETGGDSVRNTTVMATHWGWPDDEEEVEGEDEDGDKLKSSFELALFT